MLALAPVFLLFATAVIILIWQQVRPRFGYMWLLANGLTFAAWVILLVLHFNPVSPFAITGWRPVANDTVVLSLQLDTISWPYAFGLISLLSAVLMTASARLALNTNPWAWAGSLAITGAGLLAIMAGNPMTLVLGWTAIDLIELVVIVRSARRMQQSQQAVIAFAARAVGTLLAVWAIIMSRSRGEVLSLDYILPEVGVFLLMAVGLRLGVVPLHLPFTHEVRMRRGLGTVLRLAAPASALPILSRLPADVVAPQWAVWMLVFTALAALYGAAMWLTAKDELNGRPYWLIAVAGIAVACAIRGQPLAAMAWGVALLFSGGMILLFSASSLSARLIVFLGFIGVVGLPYTPAASGWQGLIVLPFTLLDIVFILAHAVLMLGYLRHLFAAHTDLKEMERWVQVLYPLGLVILVVSHWIVAITGWEGSFNPGVWWGSLASVILTTVGLILLMRFKTFPTMDGASENWLLVIGRRIGAVMAAIFSLNWLYQFFWLIYKALQNLVRFITVILEGDGGVLWAMLLLTLLFTMLTSGAAP
jgi:hypothetical protein